MALTLVDKVLNDNFQAAAPSPSLCIWIQQSAKE
jgi:hypothetical protein